VIPPTDYGPGTRLPFTIVAGGGILRQAEPRPDYDARPRHVMLAPFSTLVDGQGQVSEIFTRTSDGPQKN